MEQLASMKNIKIVVLFVFIGIASYLIFFEKEATVENRWYTKTQVLQGQEIFAKNCAICHGQKAEKTVLWKKTLPDGSYPAPPLNGDAHAWHHPYEQLMSIITNGGKLYDGKMPAFGDKLTNKEKEAAISYFQSFWTDEIYNLWIQHGGLKNK